MDANVKGRLDRMVATHPWTLFFPKAVVHHVSASRSDHRPMLLTLHGSHKMKQRRPQPFRFAKTRSLDASCKETIREAWDIAIAGIRMFGVTEAIKACARELKWWERSVFTFQKRSNFVFFFHLL